MGFLIFLGLIPIYIIWAVWTENQFEKRKSLDREKIEAEPSTPKPTGSS